MSSWGGRCDAGVLGVDEVLVVALVSSFADARQSFKEEEGVVMVCLSSRFWKRDEDMCYC